MRKQQQIDLLAERLKKLHTEHMKLKMAFEDHREPPTTHAYVNGRPVNRHLHYTEFDQLEQQVLVVQRKVWDLEDLKARVDKMDPPKPIPRFEIVKTEDGTWNLIEITGQGHQKLIGVYDTKPEAKQRVSEIVAFRQNPDKDNEVIVP